MVTYPPQCPWHTLGHTDLVTASKFSPRYLLWHTIFPAFWSTSILHFNIPQDHLSWAPLCFTVVPFTLPVRWPHSIRFTNPVSSIVLEKERQKWTRGGKWNLFPLKTECVVQQQVPQDDQDACTNLPHLSCNSNLTSGTPQLCGDYPNCLLPDAVFSLKKHQSEHFRLHKQVVSWRNLEPRAPNLQALTHGHCDNVASTIRDYTHCTHLFRWVGTGWQ